MIRNELCIILNVKPKKLFRGFYLISNSWLYPRRRPRWRPCLEPPVAPPPINIPHLVEKIKGFSLKAKSLRNTATYQKLQGGVPSTPPFCHGGGI